MANASSNPPDQSQQTDIQMASTSAQVSDDTGYSEQSKVEEMLNTAFSRITLILEKRHSDNQTHIRQVRQAWETCRVATLFAKFYRNAARLQADQIINLDTATASDISYEILMNDREKQALDAYHTILEMMRADRTTLTEIEEASQRVLSMSNGTPYSKVFATNVDIMLEGVEKERRNMDSFLVRLSRCLE